MDPTLNSLELVTLWARKLHVVSLPSYNESESMKFHIKLGSWLKPGFLFQDFNWQLQGCLENSDYLASVEQRYILPHLK